MYIIGAGHDGSMTSESSIQKAIQVGIGSRSDVRIFRNQVGAGWIGESVRLKNGDVLIKNPRYVQFGLAVGSSDLIGMKTTIITAEMIGMPMAQFLAIEVKAKSGRVTDEQKAFIAMCQERGALAGIARTVDDALGILDSVVAGTGYHA